MTKEERREYLRKYRANPINKERLRKAQKKYRLNNPEKTREYKKKWVERNKERSKISSKKWYEKNKEKYQQYALKRYYENKEEIGKYRKEYSRKKRIECLKHYGNKCVCCGETEPNFLSFDHINNDGAKHRKQSTRTMAEWLIKNNYPRDIQILCHNCNMAKGFYGKCPHQN